VELAQAFARLGSNVAIVEREPEILQAEEPELAARVRANLMAEGVAMHLGCSFDSVSHDAGQYSALLASGERWSSARFDAVLAAIGRAPNVEGMRLEAAGVRYSEHGVTINHSCQTTASHIYACGDVTGAPRFSHVAEDMARTAVMRLLLKVPAAYERRCVPWVTFTDPECGHLGQTAEQLRAANTRFETIRFPYSRLDRSLVDQASDGLILVHVSPVSGKILGAHVHGACAGELVNEFALAMRNDLSLRDIAGTVHAYPTYTLGVRRVADQWYVRSGSPRLVEMVRGLFGYRGRASEQFGGDEVV
jgi:pyruvate/2-oxoglutarate dehydrogenase complex dihydrolipoamide dehydrogenase (E3) component